MFLCLFTHWSKLKCSRIMWIISTAISMSIDLKCAEYFENDLCNTLDEEPFMRVTCCHTFHRHTIPLRP